MTYTTARPEEPECQELNIYGAMNKVFALVTRGNTVVVERPTFTKGIIVRCVTAVTPEGAGRKARATEVTKTL